MSRLELSPRGAASEAWYAAHRRVRPSRSGNPAVPENLVRAVAEYELDPALLWQAWELARCAPRLSAEEQQTLLVALTALLLAEHEGSTRLPLEPAADLERLLAQCRADEAQLARVRALFGPGSRERLSELLGSPGEVKPLILEEEERSTPRSTALCLQRMDELERRLAAALRSRFAESGPRRPGLQSALEDLLAHPPVVRGVALRLSPQQQEAVLACAERPLTLVTGGPGSGKTSIVVAILRLLARVGVAPRPADIAGGAPLSGSGAGGERVAGDGSLSGGGAGGERVAGGGSLSGSGAGGERVAGGGSLSGSGAGGERVAGGGSLSGSGAGGECVAGGGSLSGSGAAGECVAGGGSLSGSGAAGECIAGDGSLSGGGADGEGGGRGARIALAAPTGKAANRMREAIQTAMESLEAPPEADLALRRQLPEPRTLHRLLGYSPSTGRFAHGPSHPLAEDIVIVDEASMIDLALMDRLVSAIRPGGQLVLVGDARQLPSVEAGAVFRDLVAGGRAVRLGSSFRTAEAKPLQELAAAVEAGDAAGVVDRLRSAERSNEKELDFECVEFLAAAEGARMRGFLDAWVERRLRSLQGLDSLLETEWSFDGGAVAPGQADDLARLRRHLESCRVLCVTRSDARPTGAQAVNHALRDAWRDQLGGGGGGRAGFAVGEPVMMLANDYARQLFNGDQGFAIRAREGGRPAELRAAFPRKDGYGLFAADAGGSGGCRHSFAMTVHKSQGSEYDHVAVVLPEDPTHPLLTREILYTAITRARRSVTIVGTLEALRQGIERQVHRHSSIARRLAAS